MTSPTPTRSGLSPPSSKPCDAPPGQPDIGEDARQLLSLDGEVSADVIAALADDLERPRRAEVLVIDDFHLTGAAGADALALLLEYRPAVAAAGRGQPCRPPAPAPPDAGQPGAGRAAGPGPVLLGRGDYGVPLRFRRATERAGPGCGPPAQRGLGGGLTDGGHLDPAIADPVSAAGRVELHRHSVAGYFLDEVLYRQPPEVVDFMLATSVLDELSVPACTALCGQGSAALLQLATAPTCS